MAAPLKTLLQKGNKAKMPTHIEPMLCTLTREPVNNPDYIFEPKLDGYRIIAYKTKNSIKLASRSGLDYTAKYPPLKKALLELQHDLILDGEAVVLNKQGNPDFDALQLFNGHEAAIIYAIFDILWMDGYDLMELPLLERKELLQSLLKGNKILRYTGYVDDGALLYKQMQQSGGEGIVVKRKNSPYLPGDRSSNWLKTPTMIRQEFIIGGWAESDKSRSFRSLLFGAYNKKKELEWIGRSGGGYKEKEMPAILQSLKNLEIQDSPFVNPILDTKGAKIHYVKPQLVANFSFATWTKSGRIRKPATFLGFRKDKKAGQVVWEIPADADVSEQPVETNEEKVSKQIKKLPTSKDSNWRKVEQVPIEHASTFNMGDCKIDLHNVDREIWKGIPKAKLIEYYHSVAEYILPHLKDRPQSLHLKLINAGAPGMYIKDMEGREPECATVFTDKRRHLKQGKRNTIDYLVCNNEATLLYMINLGCIDINPWMSRISNPTQPDFFNIDLDPSDDDFNKVIEVAMAAKEVLSTYKLRSFAKTSGKTGMHIYIPVVDTSYEQARHYSEQLGAQIHEQVKNISTLQVSISSRKNKVFIDPSQNDYADTLAAAYSVRPNHTPTVSTPLDWKEVKPGLDPNSFTIDTIGKRLTKKGDLFRAVLDSKIGAANTKRLIKWNNAY